MHVVRNAGNTSYNMELIDGFLSLFKGVPFGCVYIQFNGILSRSLYLMEYFVDVYILEVLFRCISKIIIY